ncbi:MAG: hypothetical protein JST68_01315 [Bacteroidetes bacterium]|nr:hypothetical protein [Bacteroidota bacterium]
MYQISDQEVDYILDDLLARGIETESLRYALLDHVCVMIEEGLCEGGDFVLFYHSALRAFYKEELREIERETTFLMQARGRLVLSRGLFFLLLFVLVGGPFVGYVIASMLRSGGIVSFQVWAAAVVYSAFPLLVLCVLYLTPDRLDPLIPQRSKVLLGVHPFIKIVSK